MNFTWNINTAGLITALIVRLLQVQGLKYVKYKSNKLWNADNEALSDSAAEVLLRHLPWIPSFVEEMKYFLQLNPLLFRNLFVF